jgi:hypothetical protein
LDKEKEKYERTIAAEESAMASIEPESSIPIELGLLSVRLPTFIPDS